MKVYTLNRGSFLVVRAADIRNGYNSIAYDSFSDDVLSIDPSGYLVLTYITSFPGSSAGEIARAIDNKAFTMDKEGLEKFLNQLVSKNIINEQVK